MSIRCYGCMELKENVPVCEHCGFSEENQNNTHQLPVGTLVGGQYELGRVLGQGGFGITYIGWDRIMKQRVAVKEYFPSGYAGRDVHNTLIVTSYDNQSVHSFEANKMRFLREAESLGKLWDIPQIVRVLRYFEENGTAYIAMEYVEGMDLRKFMKRRGRNLTADELLDIMGPVIQALDFVHKADLVHRDISPDNIMVLPDGSAKLLDFGAARYVENADIEKERKTSTQAILKQGFAPPEQYRSHGALGPWTDIYAMCATIYYCLAGRVPPESMSRMMDDTPLGVDHLPGLTSQQKAALEKGMALKPKERIKSAEELYQALFSELIAARERAAQEKQGNSLKDTLQPNHNEALSSGEALAEENLCADASAKAPGSRKKRMVLWAAAAVITVAVSARLMVLPKEDPIVQHPTEPELATVDLTEETVPETSFLEAPAIQEIFSELNLELEPEQLGYCQTLSLPLFQETDTITWSSSNPAVAAVSDNGTITALGYGISEVTAFCENQVATWQVYIFRRANIDLQLGGNASTRKATGEVSGDVILPGVIDDTVIKKIGPNTLESHQEIRRVVIPDMVEAIEKRAFNDCTNLNEVTFPQRLTRIGAEAFAGTVLTDVVIPEGVTEVEWGAFYGCDSLRSVVLPESLMVMEGSIFTFCQNLTQVNIPSGITEIEHDTFLGCSSLTEITIPNNIRTIGNRAFGRCLQLKTVKFSESIWKIPPNAFEGCISLEKIILPENITVIEESAFRGCSMLYEVTIPKNVMRIESNAFGDCFNLTNITVSPGCKIADGAVPPTCSITYYES